MALWEPERKPLDENHYWALKAWLAKVHPYDDGLPPGELTYLALSYGIAVVTKIPNTLDVMLQVAGVAKVIVQSTDNA